MYKIKHNIVEKYGNDKSICFYYYLCNVVDYAGEETVIKSFESIYGQGDEIIIGNYLCTDNTKEIAEEYGFKVVDVEYGDSIIFPESKVRNKVIHESKSNFLVALNINVEYPKYLTSYIINWLSKNDIIKRVLRFRTKFENRWFYGFSTVIYKPYLIEARGYDERTGYGTGSQKYGAMLLKDIYKLRIHATDLNIIHKNSDHSKLSIMGKIKNRREKTVTLVNILKENLQEDFYKAVSEVKNSYW